MSVRRPPLRRLALGLALAALGATLAAGVALAVQSLRSLDEHPPGAAAAARRVESALWELIATADRYAEGDPAIGRDAVDQHLESLARATAEAARRLAAGRAGGTAESVEPIGRLQRTLGEREPDLRALAPGRLAEYAAIRQALVEVAPGLGELARTAELAEAADGAARTGALQHGLTLLAWLTVLGALAAAASLGLLLAENADARRRLVPPAAPPATTEASRFRAIAEALPSAILLVDRVGGTTRYENPAAAALLGPPHGGGVMARIAAACVDPAELESAGDLAAPGRHDRRAVRLRRPDGTEVPAMIAVRPVQDEGTPCSLVEIADLGALGAASAEDEQRREIRHQRDKLDALGALLAGVAHELNNPLSVVVAQATMLEELSGDQATVVRGGKIRAAAERCARIVRSFLTTARQRPPAPTRLELDPLVDATLESLGPALAAAGIAVSRERPAMLPPIAADAEQLRQVLTHLVVNAEEAMAGWAGPRRLAVATRAVPGGRPGGDMVELSVADSGPGVPPALRARIFEPFFTTKPVGAGGGIGLSVCYGAITAHGGTIAVEDAPGGGARFVVRLPATAAAAAPEAEPVDAAPGVRHVLIVDDEPEVRDTLAEILARDGYRIDMADGGRAALERIGHRRYDVVVSDIRMPDIDGIMLFRRLRELGTGLERRFVVVTGDMLSPSIRDFLDEARLPCIDKPFVPGEVRRLVAAVAGAGPSGSAAP
ncbi:MAG: response regulator [Dongiaceae bacterium]